MGESRLRARTPPDQEVSLNTKIAVTPCRADEIHELQNFIARAMKPDHILARDSSLLMWQFKPSTEDGLLSVLLARAGDQIVGMQGVIPLEFSVRGTRTRGAWLANLATLPEWRRYGVGLKLLMAPIRMDLDALLTVGLSDDVYPLLRPLGYETLDSMPRLIGIINRTACIDIGGRDLPISLVTEDDRSIVVERHEDSVPPEWDEFWERKVSPTFVGMSRTSSFINWRYVNHPRFRYKVDVLRNDTGISASVVWRIDPIPGTMMSAIRLVEILGEVASVSRLLTALFARLDRETTAFIDWYGTNDLCLRVLENIGFVRTHPEHGPSLPNRLSPLEPAETPIRAAIRRNVPQVQTHGTLLDAHFHVTKGDSDIDRPN